MTSQRLLDFDWPISHHLQIAGVLSKFLENVIQEHYRDLRDLFPLRAGCNIKLRPSPDWVAFSVSSVAPMTFANFGDFTELEINEIDSLSLPATARPFSELLERLGEKWENFDTFTYVGPTRLGKMASEHVKDNFCSWLEQIVLPSVTNKNVARVLRVIPPPPQYDVAKLLKSVWVLECEESFRQGTAFELESVGLITCQHVLGPKTHAFRADDAAAKFPIRVRAEDKHLDLAILDIDISLNNPLAKGTADNLRQMDDVAVFGFPNFTLGSTGSFHPGFVSGFRMVHGVRRLLTTASIVKGNSGGPVVGADNKVFGVAVTGADLMEEANLTDNHGIIPIDSIAMLQKY